MGRLRGLRALGAGTEDRGVDEHRPPAPLQIAPAEPMDHRVHGDGLPQPKVVGLCRLPQELDLAAAAGLVEVEAAGQGDHRPAAAVKIAYRQVDVLGGSRNRMPLPARILIPVYAVSIRGECNHVRAAVAVEVGHGDLVAGGKVVDEVALELDRLNSADRDYRSGGRFRLRALAGR